MSMWQYLQQAQQQKLLRPLDVQFARMLADDSQPVLMLAAALTSRDTAEGHVCLPLETLNPQTCFAGQHQPLAQQLFALTGDAANWRQTLLASSAVSENNEVTPLKLFRQRLYLHRLWHHEQTVSQFFTQQDPLMAADETHIAQLLHQLFASQPDTDWQKIAVAVALTRRIAVISGGPGTGKTTTVAKLLWALTQSNPARRLRIRLAAPTGKAAARLSESLALALHSTPDAANPHTLPDEACTLHRLLGVRQSSQHSRYHAGNPLHLDVLLVDEASMIDLPMMARLIAALPAHARLILLGDHEQLASVEAGAVLGDLCHHARYGYSPERSAQLTRLTGYNIPPGDDSITSPLRDSLCLLRKSYRFSLHSGIGQLARAVNNGNETEVLRILARGRADLVHKNLNNDQDYQIMLADALQGYLHYLQLLRQPADVARILLAFSQYQLLCALREGPFGVSGLNEQLEQVLIAHQLINGKAHSHWYHGRPVMITRNDSALGLFNGDTGIALQQENTIRVWFTMPDGRLKSVSPARLPAHETAWAITVHKSQGSEFDHAALVLPAQYTPVVRRELIYTAITRARHRLSLYADPATLKQGIITRTERHSGLWLRMAYFANKEQ